MRVIRNYFSGIRKMLYPLSVLVFLVVADGVITNIIVNSGIAREGNLFMVSLVGGGSFLLIKAAGALFCSFVLWDIYRQQPKIAKIGTSCLVVAYAGIVVWNLGILLTSQTL